MSPPGVLTFRKADQSDIPTLRHLAQKIWRVCYPPIIGTEQVEYMLEQMYSTEVIAHEIENGVHWRLASLEGEPVGFLSITLELQARAKLNKLYLDPALHGRGLGQELIAEACRIGSELGAAELWLQVNKKNHPAIEAYRKAAFRVEREAVFDIGSGFVMDDFIMIRGVSPAVEESDRPVGGGTLARDLPPRF